jgi:hypothetical protein
LARPCPYRLTGDGLCADPDGSSTPTPSALGFTPGDLVGCVSGELGLRGFLEAAGHTLVMTDDVEGAGCAFDCELPDASYVVSQPNFPAFFDRRRLLLARHLKAVVTAGVGSDHIDLEAAMELGIDVAEVTYSSAASVAEQIVLTVPSPVPSRSDARRAAAAAPPPAAAQVRNGLDAPLTRVRAARGDSPPAHADARARAQLCLRTRGLERRLLARRRRRSASVRPRRDARRHGGDGSGGTRGHAPAQAVWRAAALC